MPRTVKFIEKESRTVVARGWEKTPRVLLFNGYRVSVWEDEKVLEMTGGDGYTTMWIYLMPIYFKVVNFILCIF